MRPRIAVAALSARMLAESACDAGCDVVALDLFGDRDTRAASLQWLPIGDGSSIERSLLCDALRRLDGEGWVAGAGIEPHLAAACAAAPSLPLVGNTPEAVAAVRDPPTFFAALRQLGIAFPETRIDGEVRGDDWLSKDFAGSGGWHIHAARDAGEAAPTRYAQRVHRGEPISALFVANGRDARVLGVQRQIVRPRAGRPYVFRGVVGPIAVADPLRRDIESCVVRLVQRFALRGLGSVDFLLDGQALAVLEVNPRPTASIALYDRGGSMLRAHLDACRHGLLAGAPRMRGLRGSEIAFADRDVVAGDRFPAWCHDLPAAGRRIQRDDPVCTVAAAAGTEHEVRALLAARRHDVLSSLESAR